MSFNHRHDLPCTPTEALRFIVMTGRHEGADVQLPLPLPRGFFVGSHLNCDLVLSDEGVASTHAVVYEESGCLWLKPVPGSGEVLADGVAVVQQSIKLENNMLLGFGGIASLKIEGSSLPLPQRPVVPTVSSRKKTRRVDSKVTALAAIGCIACSAVFGALALGTRVPAHQLAEVPKDAQTPSQQLKVADLAALALLESSARQVDRYLADPGVKVTARPPNQIDVAGVAKSVATRGQLKKIQTALPVGVEIISTVSYPEDKADKLVKASPSTHEQPMANLAKKVLQVASSERVPFIEVEGGARVFEGGKLNGYELLKITSGVVIARRDKQIETFKVE